MSFLIESVPGTMFKINTICKTLYNGSKCPERYSPDLSVQPPGQPLTTLTHTKTLLPCPSVPLFPAELFPGVEVEVIDDTPRPTKNDSQCFSIPFLPSG